MNKLYLIIYLDYLSAKNSLFIIYLYLYNYRFIYIQYYL